MKDRYAILFLIVVGLLFYSLTLRGVLGNPKPEDFKKSLDQVTKPLELSPERGRFAGVLALAERRTYDLGQNLAEAVYPDVGVYQGRYFSFFAPGLSYLALPFYLIGRHYNLSQVGTFGFVSLISIFNLLLLYAIARKVLNLPVWGSLLASLIFGFATTSWSYAITLYQHQFTVFLMLSGFYATRKFAEFNAEQRGTGTSALFRVRFRVFLLALWVWLAYGLAVSIDYPNAVLMLPVVVYLFLSAMDFRKVIDGIKISLKPAVVFAAIALLAVAGWNADINQKYFGSWKNLAGQLDQYQIPSGPSSNALANQDSQNAVAQISAQKGLTGFFRETNVPFSFYTLTVAPDRGLFVFAPILLLALLGFWKFRKHINLEVGILIALVAANVFLYSSWGDPWGGWAYGPRYLIPSMAILSLFTAYWLSSQAGRSILNKLIAALLLAYSSGIALLGAITSNAVPPKIEAVNLPLKYYNFLYNIYLLKGGRSGSLLYNVYFSHRINLKEYFLVIYTLLVLIFLAVLFVMPRLEKEN